MRTNNSTPTRTMGPRTNPFAPSYEASPIHFHQGMKVPSMTEPISVIVGTSHLDLTSNHRSLIGPCRQLQGRSPLKSMMEKLLWKTILCTSGNAGDETDGLRQRQPVPWRHLCEGMPSESYTICGQDKRVKGEVEMANQQILFCCIFWDLYPKYR